METPKISIIIPSVREKEAMQIISAFEETNSTFDYEIVLVSPFEIKTNKVFWIPELELLGSSLATQNGYLSSVGKYIIYLNDHCFPTTNCLQTMFDFMELKQGTLFLGAFKMETKRKKEIGPFKTYGNRIYACYGCISRKSLAKLDNILFDSKYKYSCVDVDLSLRIMEAGGKVEVCQEAIVKPNVLNDLIYKEHRKTFSTDFKVFLNTWSAKFPNIPKTEEVFNLK
jgi:hypothetical protein